MIELLSCYLFLPQLVTLVAFGCGNGRWCQWRECKRKNTRCIYSLRIEGATHLSAEGADPEVLKREGRWASGV